MVMLIIGLVILVAALVSVLVAIWIKARGAYTLYQNIMADGQISDEEKLKFADVVFDLAAEAKNAWDLIMKIILALKEFKKK